MAELNLRSAQRLKVNLMFRTNCGWHGKQNRMQHGPKFPALVNGMQEKCTVALGHMDALALGLTDPMTQGPMAWIPWAAQVRVENIHRVVQVLN